MILKIKTTHIPYMYALFNTYISIYLNNILYFQKLYDPDYKLNHGFSIKDEIRFTNEDYNKAVRIINLNKHYIEKNYFKLEFDDESNVILSLKALIKNNTTEYIEWKNHNNILSLQYLKIAIRFLDLLRTLDDKYKTVNIKYFLNL